LALRWALRRIREQLVQFGLADAVYYASEEGEFDVRNNVYSQILSALREYLDAPDVRLHLVTHSLGVTVGHDFLYGLFGSTSPDFLDQARDPQDAADYLTWRRKVGDGELRVGSLTTMASQLPLFGLRKRSLVQRLAAGQTLQTGDIGIGLDDKVRWLVVYDVDDVLGFATRELYGNHPSIRQVQVDSGDDPITAHVGYWREPQTIHEAADLIAKRAAE
ncbi:MAG: hypothetical protein JWN04_1417, partial [Myxococcaceae bacterium]|nr:hypothetical protein [Myxococcaceae bacterium]